MPETAPLTPATTLASNSKARFPNESPAYRQARTALLAEEIELRRHIERVAALRRALPPGGEVPDDYTFLGEHGPLGLSDLFAGKSTLAVYSFMFGPERQAPCPVCTSLLSSWNGAAPGITDRIALAVVARSPIERLLAFQQQRGLDHLTFVSDLDGSFTRAYVSADDGDAPGLNVFTRRDGTLRHFWGGEMGDGTADPGQDPRGAPDIDPLWTVFDLTPEGRGTDWYPKLDYTPPPLVNLR